MKILITTLALLMGSIQAHAAPTLGKEFGDWRQACSKVKGQTLCHVFHQLKHKKTGEIVLHASVGYPTGKDELMLFLTVPCGVSLPHGLGLEIEGKKPLRLAYRTCRKSGCLAGIYLTKELRKDLLGAKSVHVLFANVSNRAFRVKLSTKGLKSAMDSLSKYKPKLPAKKTR